ncbi:MAG: response regulator [Planctomycetota bacterium]
MPESRTLLSVPLARGGQTALRALPPLPASSRPRILVVDDEPEVLASLAGMLAEEFEVETAGSLQQAMARIEHSPFDLVVTDLYLGADDLGCRLAGLSARRSSIPVLLLTGKPSFRGAQEALRDHVADIFVKPVDPLALRRRCRGIIQETTLARRNQELEAQNQILASVLPRAIEVKDPTTAGHAERVVGYVDTLAQRLGVGEEDRDALRLAGLLHDVGKIGIPSRILTKPGPLTAEEREVVFRHPKMGYDILEPLKHHAKMRQWVYQHHERWDGKGYPNGLQGEEVELPGRILVLAEVFDALAEPRSYKSSWEMPRIASYFREQAGRQFDPEVARFVADGIEKRGKAFFGSTLFG